MRQVALVMLMIVGLAAAASAAPVWWDEADFETQLTGTVENIGGQGEAEGTVTVTLENDPLLGMYKEVFVEFDWWRVYDPDGSASFDPDVEMNWDGHPAKVSLNLVDSGTFAPDGFWFDYDYTIIPQPANETFYFRFTGLLEGDELGFEYDIRTKCFEDIVPEPAGLAFAGIALLALRRRRS